MVEYSSNILVIYRDFNCSQIKMNTFEDSSKDRQLVDWCMDNYLEQHVSMRTRPQSQNILDLVFSSFSTNINCASINECFGTSDHVIVSFVLDAP